MNEQQIKNTLAFLQRVDLKGQEAVALVDVQQTLMNELREIESTKVEEPKVEKDE